MKEYLETTYIVYIPEEKLHGVVENMGIYMSEVTYKIGQIEYTQLMNNEDFIVMHEIKTKRYEDIISIDEIEENN